MKVETTYSHAITSFFGPFYLLKTTSETKYMFLYEHIYIYNEVNAEIETLQRVLHLIKNIVTSISIVKQFSNTNNNSSVSRYIYIYSSFETKNNNIYNIYIVEYVTTNRERFNSRSI